MAVVLQMQLGYRESLAPNTLSIWEWAGHGAETQSKPATQASASLWLPVLSPGTEATSKTAQELPAPRTNGLGSPALTHSAGVHQQRWKSPGQAGKFKED